MTFPPAPADLLYYTERGSGAPLLLVHGLMVTGEMFEPVIEHLATLHRVIVPDLRGHGRSRELPPPYSAAQLASDFVLDHPKRCSHLVLACTYAFNMATFREKIEGHLFPLFVQLFGLKRIAKTAVSVGAKHLSKERSDWLVRIMADQDQKLMVSAWREAMAFDSRRRLGEIMCQTLIVAGSNDQAVPIHHAKMLHDGISGSRLVIIDGADHSLIWTHPDELARVTDEFLAI